VIVNCASASGLPGTARREDRGTLAALMAIGGSRVIHFSSVAVYGTCLDSKRNTFSRPQPDYPYGRDKLNLERYAGRLASKMGKRLTVLRMGHVYGAEQWLSRYVFDAFEKATWRLPFDGALSSNAVHVGNVAAALHEVVTRADLVGTFNLFDEPERTWRGVFDWNTAAIGVPRIGPMDEEESSVLLQQHRRVAATSTAARVAFEAVRWGRALPVSLVRASPALRFAVLSTLAALQSPALEQKILKVYSGERMGDGRAVRDIEPWLFADRAPGPRVPYVPELGTVDAERTAQWYRTYSSPDDLWPGRRTTHGGVVLSREEP
jgi:dTDP-4-dehydrorhamnose reductase